ncbi:hypothetical protein Dimus_002935 [Dionaea muscipula]
MYMSNHKYLSHIFYDRVESEREGGEHTQIAGNGEDVACADYKFAGDGSFIIIISSSSLGEKKEITEEKRSDYMKQTSHLGGSTHNTISFILFDSVLNWISELPRSSIYRCPSYEATRK